MSSAKKMEVNRLRNLLMQQWKEYKRKQNVRKSGFSKSSLVALLPRVIKSLRVFVCLFIYID